MIRAQELQFELGPLFRALFSETNPIPVKAAMEHCGYGPGELRLPLSELSDAHREDLAAVLDELEETDMTRVLVSGATGRMGRTVIAEASARDDAHVVAGVGRDFSGEIDGVPVEPADALGSVLARVRSRRAG